MKRYTLLIISVIFIACTTERSSPDEKTAEGLQQTKSPETKVPNVPEQFDLDLDGTADEITWNFTGGAHCCYQLSITLSSTKTKTDFPFNMDGGYIGGVPMEDRVKDRDGDGYPELYMRIETYNGEVNEIPAEWKKVYGISGNDVFIEVEDGMLKVSDSI